MASSNRHWPSMFKSKPCTTHHHHHQWQHDINSPLISTTTCHRSGPFSSGGQVCEERSPEPKPRWNPKPEQIRILEAIFNSGMVNPPRDEIRKIRGQLQEYGQVGDANVFYWFQNRKSRSKHKNRHLLHNNKNTQTPPSPPPPQITITAPTSSSSSSEKSSPQSATKVPFSAGSMNQTYNFQPDPFFFPVQPQQITTNVGNDVFSHGFSFSDLSNVVQIPDNHQSNEEGVGSYHGFLLSELMMNNQMHSKKLEEEKLHNQLGYSTSSVTAPLDINLIQGVGESGCNGANPVGLARTTVFINDVAFELTVGSFNVRECFGDDAVLIHSSGQPVLTNEWGVTLHPLQHGAFYYLI